MKSDHGAVLAAADIHQRRDRAGMFGELAQHLGHHLGEVLRRAAGRHPRRRVEPRQRRVTHIGVHQDHLPPGLRGALRQGVEVGGPAQPAAAEPHYQLLARRHPPHRCLSAVIAASCPGSPSPQASHPAAAVSCSAQRLRSRISRSSAASRRRAASSSATASPACRAHLPHARIRRRRRTAVYPPGRSALHGIRLPLRAAPATMLVAPVQRRHAAPGARQTFDP